MDLETTIEKMLAQIDTLQTSAMTREFGWKVAIGPPTVFISLSGFAEPERIYLLRIEFDDYDRRAPSYTFVDPVSRVWSGACRPSGVEHSDGKICTPGTREFHEDLHKNDAQYLWDPQKYTVLGTVRMIHRMMNQ